MMGTSIPLGVFLLLSLLCWNSQAAGKSVGVYLRLRGERKASKRKDQDIVKEIASLLISGI